LLNKPNLKPVQRFPDRNKNNWSLNIQGNQQIIALLNKIYENQDLVNICMKRKYNKYLEILEIEKENIESCK